MRKTSSTLSSPLMRRMNSMLLGHQGASLRTDCVYFSIASRGPRKGVDHLGIQVESDADLAVVAGRLAQAGQTVSEQKATTCCYARSNKAWVDDPDGVAWETFHTFGESTTYGNGREEKAGSEEFGTPSPCCTPEREAAKASPCCASAIA